MLPQKRSNNILIVIALIAFFLSCKERKEQTNSLKNVDNSKDTLVRETKINMNDEDSLKDFIASLNYGIQRFKAIEKKVNYQKSPFNCVKYIPYNLYTNKKLVIVEYPLLEDGGTLYGKGRLFIDETGEVIAHIMISGQDSTFEFFKNQSLYYKYHKSEKTYITILNEETIHKRNKKINILLNDASFIFNMRLNKKLLTTNDISADLITMSEVKVFEIPDTLSKISDTLKPYSPLKYLKTIDIINNESIVNRCPVWWYKIITQSGNIGWVRNDLGMIAEYNDENYGIR